MRWMGWSWDDLQTAPADVVDEICAILVEQNDKR
jgi:hypothetical protein